MAQSYINGVNSRTSKGFTGQRLDIDSGLMYYGARYYDPMLAYFISPDAIVPGTKSDSSGAVELGVEDYMTTPSARAPCLDEEYSRLQLEKWILARQPHVSLQWRFEPNGRNTAPDFHLTINGQTYAVEVTSLEWSESAGDAVVSSSTWWEAFDRLRGRLMQECQQQGILRGLYLMRINRRVPNFARFREVLRQDLKKYVDATMAQEQSPAQDLTVNGEVIGEIVKITDQGSFIAPSGFGSSWPQTAPGFNEILQTAVNRKIEVLATESLPRVIVLLDRFHHAAPSFWDDVINATSAKQVFPAIFVVTATDQDYMLHSNEGHWPTIDTDNILYSGS